MSGLVYINMFYHLFYYSLFTHNSFKKLPHNYDTSCRIQNLSLVIPYITIEVSNNNVIQIAGKRNRQINHIELDLIKKWAKKLNFTIEQYLLLE